MFKQNIILTGFMGTGKSAIGRILAQKMGRDFIDTDELIVQQTGLTIDQLFREQGESAFRILETNVVRHLADRQELVVATGGGLVVNPLNVLRLAQNGVIICLSAGPYEILKRLSLEPNKRPLLSGSNPEKQIQVLLVEREVAYGQFPQIDTNGKDPDQVVDELLHLIHQEKDKQPWSQPPLSRLPVRYPGGRYEIFVGRGLLPVLANLVSLPGQTAVLTDENVRPLHAQQLAHLKALKTITFPAGEKQKNLDTVRTIYEELLAAGLDRQGTLINLGGGVVGDIGGFIAATYLRGINVAQCPTTILAMVDASLGGKTGVDLPQGKNLVGAFKQPEAVIADLNTLTTLPPAELSAGMAEVIKHGLIANTSYLSTLTSDFPALSEDLVGLAWQVLLVEAIQVKQAIIEEDPFESGRRAVLNLGHTFAHAIEQVSHYSVAHGPAVAIGLVAATHLSASLGYCSPQLQDQVEAVLIACGLPTRVPAGLSPDDLQQAMTTDKKRAAGQLRFVLLRQPGDVFLSSDVPVAAIGDTWRSLQS